MTKKHYSQGGDAKAIKKVADERFEGNYAAMFEHHDWPERGSDMMRKVQTRVVETYGSVREFEAHFEAKSKPAPGFDAEPFNDAPIEKPEEDIFGFNDFAKAIADGIAGIKDPVGSVIAVYGRWGSGKSSAVNLVRRHLEKTESDISVVPFQCWHYRSEDALAAGFFKELYAGLKSTLSESNGAKEAFLELGAHIAGAGNLLGTAIGAVAGSAVENATKSAFGALENYIEAETGPEALQSKVAKALETHSGRFLVVIDDLDRMSTDEALVVFRLIKSVGRLPNVIYLLAYDREVIEDAVAKKYPSEGPHYLEKIVQAGFQLPEPGRARLNAMLEERIKEITGDEGDYTGQRLRHFQNRFYGIVAPEIRTPRDVHRLSNALSVTWPAVRGEVYVADFIALETLRLFRPKLHQTIQMNKPALTGEVFSGNESDSKEVDKYSQIFMAGINEADQPRLKDGLIRLFPSLEAVWRNIRFTTSHLEENFATCRRVCSGKHFDSYFRFSLSGQTVPLEELRELIARADEANFIKETFFNALKVTQDEGRTKASYLLDELNFYAYEMPLNKVEGFLSALFSIADDLNNETDKERGYYDDGVANNNLRIRSLLRSLLLTRTALEGRSAIIKSALKAASFEGLVDIHFLASKDHSPVGKSGSPKPSNECLMTEADVAVLQEQALNSIRKAAADGRLVNAKDLVLVLRQWGDMAGPDSAEVNNWCEKAIEDDRSLPRLADAFLGEGYTVNPAIDLVGLREDCVRIDSLKKFLNADRFRERLKEAVDNDSIPLEDREIMQRLLDAWKAEEIGRN